MANISIPQNEMTSFDLPKVCIVTGDTQNVQFRPVKFQWYPRWIGVFGIAPLIMVILLAVLMRRAKGELPFSDAAWAAWNKGKMMLALSIVGGILLFGGGIAALANRMEGLGALMLLSGIVVPIVLGIVFLAGKGPTCLKIDNGYVELKIKSDSAAEMIRRHLQGGGRKAQQAA